MLEKRKRKVSKEEHLENNQFTSLAASSKAKNIEIYREYITKVLEELEKSDSSKKKNRNIAISGGYGAGKSSIIKTYFNDSKDVIYVSLGSYVEKNVDKNDTEHETEKRLDEIETSILQQIIYTVDPKDVPYSRIKRIDNNFMRKELKNIAISFVTTLLLISFFIIKNYKIIQKITSNNPINAVVLSIIFSLSFVITLFIVRKINNNIDINKVNINGVELSKEESSISILNRNIDELIHFFNQNPYDKIIFEDIERLNNHLIVFSKLKEINMILNNSLNKTVQFIYAIGDTVFTTAENRTKFFDAIIPIVPYSGTKSSRDIFADQKYKKLGFNDDILKVICRYVDNTRISYDIINEYDIYSKILIKADDYTDDEILRKDKDSLLVLSAYKILYPLKYDLLLKNKGKIAYFFSNDFKEIVKKEYQKEKVKEIKELEKILKTKEEYLITSKDFFLKNIIDNVKGYIPFYYTESQIFILNDSKKICNIRELEHGNISYVTIEEIRKSNNIEFLVTTEDKTAEISEDEIFTFTTKDDFCNMLLYNDKYNSDIEKIVERKATLEKETGSFNINEIEIEKLTDILNNLEKIPEDYQDERNVKVSSIINSFEKWMITSGNINNRYRQLLINNHGNVLRPSDNELLQLILDNEPMNYDFPIFDAKNLLDELSYYDFANDSVCMKKLFESVLNLNANKRENYLKQFYIHLNCQKLEFIIKLERDGISIIKYSTDYFDRILDVIKQNELSVGNIELIVFKIIEIKGYKNPAMKSFIENFISNLPGIETHFSEYQKRNDLEKNFKNYNFQFKQSFFDSGDNNRSFYNYLEDNKMLCYNVNLINAYTLHKEIVFNKKFILESAATNGKESYLYCFLIENIDKTLEMIKSTKIIQNDSECFLINFIENNNLTSEQLRKLLELENIRFTDISKIGHYDLLKELDKVYINYHNLNILFEDNDSSLDAYIISKIIENIDNLIKEKTNHNEFRKFFTSIHENEELSLNIFEKIIDTTFTKEWHYTSYSNKLSIDKNKYLLEVGKMYADDPEEIVDGIKEILTKEGLEEKYKLKYLENSWSAIKKEILDDIDTEIINYLLKMPLNKQEIIDYVFKYDSSIYDIETYNELFLICQKQSIKFSDYKKLYEIISNTNYSAKEKLELYLKYKKELEKYTLSLLPKFGADYKAILDDKNRKELASNELNKELLDVLTSKNIINHYNQKGRKFIIYYNPRRNQKKSNS